MTGYEKNNNYKINTIKNNKNIKIIVFIELRARNTIVK
jgi:hypothetical protein